MPKPLSLAQKISNKALKSCADLTDYLAIVNAVSDKEAFALAVTTLDQSLIKGGDFQKWVAGGFSHSKRAMRVFHDVMGKLDTPASNAVLDAKKSYIYSVCKGRNVSSSQQYLANRVQFLADADKALEAM